MTTPTGAGLPDVDPITGPADPRLEGWYHTIDLAPGVVTKGVYDLRRLVGSVGIPDDLTGCTALDIGTANGFWAFEMERRGASRVVAVDVASHHDWDWLPHLRPSDEPDPIVDMRERFALAHAMRGSEVDYESVNVYDLSPETVGVFDVVYCGSLLLHLQAPLCALSSIRSVTREMAIIEFCVDDTLESLVPELPCLRIGPTVNTGEPGIEASYSWFNTAGIVQMLEFAGFTDCVPMPPQRLFPYDVVIRTVRARPRQLAAHSIAVTNPAVFAERFPAPTHAVPDPSEDPPSARELGPPIRHSELHLLSDPAIDPLLAALGDDVVASAAANVLQLHQVGMQRELEERNAHLAELEEYVAHILRELAARDEHVAELESYVSHVLNELEKARQP